MTTNQDAISRGEGHLIVISTETIGYVIVGVIAIGLRLIVLGSAPLTEHEAVLALAARGQGATAAQAGEILSSPLLAGLLSWLFAILPLSNGLARFLPALVGSLLVLSPLMFRHRLGRLPTLMAVTLLAISPIAVGVSRHLTGEGLAVLLFVAGLTLLDRVLQTPDHIQAMLAGGLLMLSLLTDSFMLGVVLCVACGAFFAFATDEEHQLSANELANLIRSSLGWWFAGGLAFGVLVAGLIMIRLPGGIGYLGDVLVQFGSGFVDRPSDASYAGYVLLMYVPLTLLFGLIGAWLASQSSEPWQRLLAGWSVVALLFSLIYQGMRPEQLLWIELPLVMLASLSVSELLHLEHDAPVWSVRIHTMGSLALCGAIGISLIQYLRSGRQVPVTLPWSTENVISLPIDFILAGLWAALLIIMWMFIASAWGDSAAWRGAGAAFLVIGGMASAGQSASIAFSRATNPYEPLNRSAGQESLTRLVRVIDDVSSLSTGDPTQATITIQNPASPVLIWALRDFPHTTYVDQVSPGVDSDMVITPRSDAVSVTPGADYIGQDSVIVRAWTASELSLDQVARWFLYRTVDNHPAQEYSVILWVRAEIYHLQPGALSASGAGNH